MGKKVNINEHLGKKLTSLRKDINYGIRSQEDLASLMGVKQGTISRLERGLADWDASYIIRICEIYKITPNEFMGYDKISE